MKEKLQEHTPLEMKRIEEGRFTEEQAHEVANLIITKLEGCDLSKLEPKDYEEVLADIESIKRWASGSETTTEKLLESLKIVSATNVVLFLIAMGVVEASAMLGVPNLTLQSFVYGSLLVSLARTPDNLKNYERSAGRDLSKLTKDTEERLEAEKKY